MSQLAIRALRVVLVLLALGSLGLQVILIVVAVTEGASGWDVLYVGGAVATVACAQVGLVAIWVLLSMVRRDVIFDERAFGWVGVLAVAGLVASFILAVLCAVTGEADDAPGLILVGGGIGLAGVGFALLMVVMRTLLYKATRLRRELDEVV